MSCIRNRLLLVVLILWVPHGVMASPKEMLKDSLVRLNVHFQDVGAYYPWKWGKVQTRSGQGLVVGDQLVLTLAALVHNATLVEARLNAEPTPSRLKVLHVDMDRGLALLQGELPPEARPIELPRVSDFVPSAKIKTFWKTDRGRFMEGQGTLDRADAVVSGDSYQSLIWYEGSNVSVQGGFGEPVFLGDNLIGIGGQNGRGSDLSILPVEMIHQRYDFPSGSLKPQTAMAGFIFDACTQRNLRKLKGLVDADGGCLITAVLGQGSGSTLLKVGDVLLTFDHHALDAWGRYEHPQYDWLSFEHLLSTRILGEKVPIEVMRNGERLKLDMLMESIAEEAWLIPEYRNGKPSRYFIRGGFVFQNLSLPYLMAWGRDWHQKAPDDLLMVMEEARGLVKTPDRQEVVVLSQVLSHPLNRGLQYLGPVVIEDVNGEALRGLNHLKSFLDDESLSRVQLTLRPNGTPLILNPKLLGEADEDIAKSYGIGVLENL